MKYLFTFFFMIGFSASVMYAQETKLNDYKYVIVDNQYDFQYESNQYRFNELAVFELEKRNFKAYRNVEVLPKDLNIGTCNALRLKIEKSGSLRVNLVLRLENCDGTTVFTTKKGVGTTKSFDKAYFEALRDAMTSLDAVNYVYEKPHYTEALPGPTDIDSIRTRSGQAGRVTIDSKETSETALGFEKKVNDLPPPEPEIIDVVEDLPLLYKTKSGVYELRNAVNGFELFKGNRKVGQLRRTKGGCHLVIADEFTGIGYYAEGSTFIIEYEKDGPQFLFFKKVF